MIGRMAEQTGVSDADRIVSENLRAVLARRQLSARALAGDLDVPERPLRRRLRGEVPWSVGEVAAIATHLGLPLAELIERA